MRFRRCELNGAARSGNAFGPRAKDMALNFSRGRARQCVKKFDDARILVGRKPALDEVLQGPALLVVTGLRIVQDDERRDDVSARGISRNSNSSSSS